MDCGELTRTDFAQCLADYQYRQLIVKSSSLIHGVVRTVQKNTNKVRGIRQITADDVVSLNYETEDNCLVTITLNAQSSNFNQELTLTGEGGQLIMQVFIHKIVLCTSLLY